MSNLSQESHTQGSVWTIDFWLWRLDSTEHQFRKSLYKNVIQSLLIVIPDPKGTQISRPGNLRPLGKNIRNYAQLKSKAGHESHAENTLTRMYSDKTNYGK